MSIINEALKKTQDQLQVRQQTPPITSLKNNKWLWFVAIFVTGGFVGCVMIFIFLINVLNPVITPATKTVSPHPAPPPPADTAPLSSSQTPSGTAPLVLNGIIVSGDENLALINNRIYKEGAFIGDKKVLKIYRDKVEIFSEGEMFTLTTQ